MIARLPLEEADIVEQIWSLQHQAYRLETRAVGLAEAPPLPDTFDSIRSSGDAYYGVLSEDGRLLGAAAVRSEAPGTLDITRLMVHPERLRQGIGSSLVRYVLDNHPEAERFTVAARLAKRPGGRSIPPLRLCAGRNGPLRRRRGTDAIPFGKINGLRLIKYPVAWGLPEPRQSAGDRS